MPYLIDSGASLRGWTELGRFYRCPQLYAYYSVSGALKNAPTGGRTRGILGHVGLAHHYLGLATEQQGAQASDIYPPLDAMGAWAARHKGDLDADGKGPGDWLPGLRACVESYLRQEVEPPGEILAVEQELLGVLGWCNGIWGFWLVDPQHCAMSGGMSAVAAAFQPYSPVPGIWPPGATSAPAIYPAPGPSAGPRDPPAPPIYRTRRLDLIVQTHRGVEVWDHKFHFQVGPALVEDYALDGQFNLARAFGEQLYGRRFAGCWVNLVQTQPAKDGSYRILRERLVVPRCAQGWSLEMWQQEARVVQLCAQDPEGWHWPRARAADACRGRWGDCDGKRLCLGGPR